MIVYKDPRRIVVAALCVDLELKCVAIIPACYQSGYQLYNVSMECGYDRFGVTSVTGFWKFLEVPLRGKSGLLEISHRIIYKVNPWYSQYVCIVFCVFFLWGKY